MKKFLRSIYNAIPFKKHLFQLLKPLGLPHNITRHLVFDGVINIKVYDGKIIKMHNEQYPLEQIFFWEGISGWESYSNKLWYELAKSCNVIFDIGANTGIYTLLAKAANPNADIYSFEPVRLTYEILKKNVAINKINNVHLKNYAVSNNEGEAEFYDMKDKILYQASLEKKYIDTLEYDKSSFTSYPVEIVSLKKVIETESIEQICLMKIDVETHEPKVIEGLGLYLRKFNPILLIEILTEEVALNLASYFDPNHYTFYDIDEAHGYRQVTSLSPSSTYNFIICPNERLNYLHSVMYANK